MFTDFDLLMHIDIYSVKGTIGEALKDRLSRALAALHVENEIEEINSVERFVRDGIPSIPAIQIGQKVFLHGTSATVDETVSRVMEYVIKGQAPSILVPVDFSEESMHAVQFASVVAKSLNLDITLTHIHAPIYDPVTGGACDVLLEHEQQTALHDLAMKMTRENKEAGIPVSVDVHIESGDPATNLIQLSSSDQFEMIIMSTKGKSSFFRNFFGSISSRVSRHSHKPVMIIPPMAKVSFPNNWLVGFDEAFLESPLPEKMLEYHSKYNIGMDFTHVHHGRYAIESKLLDTFINRIHYFPNGQAPLGYTIIDDQPNQPVEEVLLRKLKQDKCDLLVLFSQDRTFIESIQHSSVIRKALVQTDIPVLVFPITRKKV